MKAKTLEVYFNLQHFYCANCTLSFCTLPCPSRARDLERKNEEALKEAREKLFLKEKD